jgi:uncharacterized membrane protein
VNPSLLSRSRANFLAGLAIILPAVISVAVLIWLFGTVANITDTLLWFVPRSITHRESGNGPMYWYWSAAAFALAVALICAVGLVARYYVGKRVIALIDSALLRIPLLNKIYSTVKQVNDAFSSGNKTAFRTVVLIEFPRKGIYSIGFITSEQQAQQQLKTDKRMSCVFVPTTPNPTSGFMMLVPEDELTRLDMSVADGIKYIISLGSIIPETSVKTGGVTSGAERIELPHG